VTSLVNSLFLPDIQHVIPELTIPPSGKDNATTHIVDSSARIENRDQLDVEIRKADVIAIVYAIDEPLSFDRIHLFWLPYIRKLVTFLPLI
jgi:Ras family protein T1